MTKDGVVTVTAPTTAIIGNLTVDGTIAATGGISTDATVIATGEVTGNGIALSTHTHAVLAADFGNTDVPS
jgi:phage baseplate assembly protein gpV